MRKLSKLLLVLSLVLALPATAEEDDLVGFSLSLAAQKLRTLSHTAEARKLESFRNTLPGYRLEYVFVRERYLNPGLYSEGEAIGSYEIYGLAANSSDPAPNYEKLVWTTVEDKLSIMAVLRNFAPLLAESPREVEVLNRSSLARLRKLLLLNKQVPEGHPIDRDAIDVFRQGIFPDIDVLPFADDTASIIMIGFTGPRVHAYAVPAPNARWQPTIIHLWTEERTLALNLLDFLDGPVFPFRIIIEPHIIPNFESPTETDAFLSELARSLVLRFGEQSNQRTVIPSERQVNGGRVIVSGFVENATLQADSATIAFEDNAFAFVDDLRLIEDLDVFQSPYELRHTVLRMGPAASRPPNLLQHTIEFGELSASAVAEFIEMSRDRGHDVMKPDRPSRRTSDRPQPRDATASSHLRYRILASEIAQVDAQLRRVVECVHYVLAQQHFVKEVLVLDPEFPKSEWRALIERPTGSQRGYVRNFLADALQAPITLGNFASINPDDANTVRVIILVE